MHALQKPTICATSESRCAHHPPPPHILGVIALRNRARADRLAPLDRRRHIRRMHLNLVQILVTFRVRACIRCDHFPAQKQRQTYGESAFVRSAGLEAIRKIVQLELRRPPRSTAYCAARR